MKRTPETLAKVVRILFCKCCNSSDDYNSIRLEKANLKLLAGLPKLNKNYIDALRQSLHENNMYLFDFKKFYVVIDIPQLSNAPKIPKHLLTKLLPSNQEIKFSDEKGCLWSVNHPVWND